MNEDTKKDVHIKALQIKLEKANAETERLNRMIQEQQNLIRLLKAERGIQVAV